ncbi:assimilatory sulfite reductase (NADPH) flavoprotein subunit [Virgibacillus sp. DJP39]|uniref:assimilatory sulfite reductase (NADPH) flavoprotein subunit n=1 Tax=Virgibacillus sp. DJP39 TaxID=3409790 RepID=UPI003BB4B042
MQLQVKNSPFNQEQTDLLNNLLPTLTETQKVWLGGYLAASGTAESQLATAPTDQQPGVQASAQISQPASREVTVLFGSETGNGQQLAEGLAQRLKEQGLQVALSAMDDFKPKELKKVQDLLIVTATHGEGDPPDNALSFNEFIFGRKAPKLSDVRFSVLALGDQSYEFFCLTGQEVDKRLEELGGERLYPRVDCDVDFDDDAAEWIEGVLGTLKETSDAQSADVQATETEAGLQTKQSAYSRTNPFRAEILDNFQLNGRGSNKETRHLELSLEGSNFEFEPGDSLGIFPENNQELVNQIIDVMNWKHEESVPINKQGEVLSVRNALLYNFEITRLTKPLLEQAEQLFGNEALSTLIEQEEERKAYLDGRDLLDLIKDYPPQEVSPGEFIQILRKIPARLYSISSSYRANPDEVHLTIGTVRYQAHGRDRTGVCSGQCAERTEAGGLLPVYVHRNPNFKFPADQHAPIIMIGPGTGVAPFRSFLEEREETGVEGKTWLFFGEQHFSTDFLYQVEWQNWLKEGVLSKMDVAFSRDTEEKVYIQHRMLEQSKELYQWLQEGASVYVCGDEKHMAHDVHTTLAAILEKEGGMTHEEAEVYLTDMRQQKRYQRDVY